MHGYPTFLNSIEAIRYQLHTLLKVYTEERRYTPVKLPVVITCFSGGGRELMPAQIGNDGDIASLSLLAFWKVI